MAVFENRRAPFDRLRVSGLGWREHRKPNKAAVRSRAGGEDRMKKQNPRTGGIGPRVPFAFVTLGEVATRRLATGGEPVSAASSRTVLGLVRLRCDEQCLQVCRGLSHGVNGWRVKRFVTTTGGVGRLALDSSRRDAVKKGRPGDSRIAAKPRSNALVPETVTATTAKSLTARLKSSASQRETCCAFSLPHGSVCQ